MNFAFLTVPTKIKKDLDKYITENKTPIITRFPPAPSSSYKDEKGNIIGGGLHLGHVKALYINMCIAKKYEGECIIRIDDTNPKVDTNESELAILEDLKYLGCELKVVTHTSDYFDKLMKYAEQFINNGMAYVDLTEKEEMRKMRDDGVETKYRGNTIEENVKYWNKMKSGELDNGCLRLKIDMKHKNKAMRDFTIYRPLNIAHHRVKDKYKVFPSYDFICPIVDSIEGITHVFRSDEFNERDDQYKYILKALDMRIPVLYHYGKLGIKGSVMSKRKLNKAIEDKIYYGYDDPRLYTIKGLKCAGMQLEGLEKFMSMTGYPLSTIELEPDNFWSVNRKVIDKYAGQYIALPKSDIKIINIDGIAADNIVTKEINKYNRYPALGKKAIYYTPNICMLMSDVEDLRDNDEFTLIDYGNMIYKNSTLTVSHNEDIKSTTKKLRWIPVSENNTVIKIKKCDLVITETDYVGEPSISSMKIGDIARFKNMNYYMLTNITTDCIYCFIEIK